MRYAAGDPNLYRYCGNNPVSYNDPSGLVAISPQTVGSAAETWAGSLVYGGYMEWHGGWYFVPNGAIVQTSESPWGGGLSIYFSPPGTGRAASELGIYENIPDGAWWAATHQGYWWDVLGHGQRYREGRLRPQRCSPSRS